MQPVVVHIATKAGSGSLRNVRSGPQTLGAEVLSVLYDDLLDRATWPRGLYLFTDMERATPWQARAATHLWQELAAHPTSFSLLNHPIEHLKRPELLRKLYDLGINQFNAYRLDELNLLARFPVFVRYADRHIGPSTGLLEDRRQLESALSKLLAEGHDEDRLLVVEFMDTSDDNGVFRKYGALRIGDRVLAGHMFAGTDWNLKRASNERGLVGTEDVDYIRANPHEEQVRRAFDVSGLSWGRMDYSVVDGKIQVWEINDNPKLGSSLFKKTKGRKPARRVYRPIRRAAFVDALSRIEPGEPLQFRVSAAEVGRACVEPALRPEVASLEA